MEIVMNIDENVFTRLFDNGIEDYEMSPEDISAIATAIRSGTSLPKGHGDLIDKNELLDNSYEINSMFCLYDEVVNVDDIKSASIIIAADKGSEENEDSD